MALGEKSRLYSLHFDEKRKKLALESHTFCPLGLGVYVCLVCYCLSSDIEIESVPLVHDMGRSSVQFREWAIFLGSGTFAASRDVVSIRRGGFQFSPRCRKRKAKAPRRLEAWIEMIWTRNLKVLEYKILKYGRCTLEENAEVNMSRERESITVDSSWFHFCKTGQQIGQSGCLLCISRKLPHCSERSLPYLQLQ